MLRVKKDSNGIKSINRYFHDSPPSMNTELDSFILIPGITLYTGIYTRGANLVFVEQTGNTIVAEFNSEGELERFFTQLSRDIKLSQLLNINIEK